MSSSLWLQCLQRLQEELPAAEFSMWVRPLQAELNDNTLTLFAPNRFVLDWVRDKYLNNINRLLMEFSGNDVPNLRFEVGSRLWWRQNPRLYVRLRMSRRNRRRLRNWRSVNYP